MQKINAKELLIQLQTEIRGLILKTDYLMKEPATLLSTSPAAGKWSVMQILEHLNSYARYYVPQIQKNITHAEQSHRQSQLDFKPGWLGDYFTKLMLPAANGKILNPMQSPKDHRPISDLEVKYVFREFMDQQYRLLDLLDRALHIDLGKTRVPVSISRLIKLKLGDTFRFYIAHQQRHFIQIENTLNRVGSVTGKYQEVLPAG